MRTKLISVSNYTLNRQRNFVLVLLLVLGLFSCTLSQKVENNNYDPLPSWNDGKTKMSIIDFVNDVTNPSSLFPIIFCYQQGKKTCT